MSTLAERLNQAMTEAGINQADLARRCGVKPPSVHGWLGGKSKFLRGENLLKAAAVLGVNQNWLATGSGPMKGAPPPPVPASQSEGLDLGKLSTVLMVVEGAIKDSRKEVPPEFKARMIKRVYESKHALTADSAGTVRALLAEFIETMGV